MGIQTLSSRQGHKSSKAEAQYCVVNELWMQGYGSWAEGKISSHLEKEGDEILRGDASKLVLGLELNIPEMDRRRRIIQLPG